MVGVISSEEPDEILDTLDTLGVRVVAHTVIHSQTGASGLHSGGEYFFLYKINFTCNSVTAHSSMLYTNYTDSLLDITVSV